MSWYSWAWLGWCAYFAAVEGVALLQSRKAKQRGVVDPRDTLSEHIWWWFGINRGGTGVERHVNAWARIRRVALGGFLLWLAIHMLTGGGYF